MALRRTALGLSRYLQGRRLTAGVPHSSDTVVPTSPTSPTAPTAPTGPTTPAAVTPAVAVSPEECRRFDGAPLDAETAARLLAAHRRLQAVDLASFRPLPPSVGDARSFLGHSESLQALVRLGVDVFRLSRDRAAAAFVLRADFERDLAPLFAFLRREVGLGQDEAAQVVVQNPRVLLDGPEGCMRRVVHFLANNGFQADEIRRVAIAHSAILTMESAELDRRLLLLQTVFFLTGSELRAMLVEAPALIARTAAEVRRLDAMLRRAVGLTRRQVHALVTGAPLLLSMSAEQLRFNLALLLHEHKLPPDTVAGDPRILLAPPQRLQERLTFLRHSGRAQFDPRQPLYVPPGLLAARTDADFIAGLPGRAPVPLEVFDAFLRSL